jgi:hypothetical protein
MKTIARSDNNRSVMTLDTLPTRETLEEQYGEGYFGRVYRTSLLVFAIAAVLVWSRGSLPGLIGLSYGAAISLGSLRAIEIVVRGLFRPEVRLNRRIMVALMIVKLPLLALVLGGAAWMVAEQIANPFALVGGVALVQAVMFLKAVGSLLVSSPTAEPARVSAPWMKAEHWRALAASVRTQLNTAERARAARGRVPGEAGWAARPEPLPASD